MVKAVSSVIEIPYVVGGGIRTAAEAKNVVKAGADIIQVGTAFEKKGGIDAVKEFVKAVREGSKR
jgi:phosphoglycerol geranylgeranyltransferase